MRSNSVNYGIIILLLIVTSFFSLQLFFKTREAHDIVKINSFPYTIGEWKGKDLPLTEQEYKILETRNIMNREYINSKGEKVWSFVVYSETNRSVFHPPEVCLIGSGVAIIDKKVATVSRKAGKPFTTNVLSMEYSGSKGVTLYSYKAGDLYTDNFYLQQMYLLAHQAFGRRIPGATIRVSMPVAGSEKATIATLKAFLGKTADGVDGVVGKVGGKAKLEGRK